MKNIFILLFVILISNCVIADVTDTYQYIKAPTGEIGNVNNSTNYPNMTIASGVVRFVDAQIALHITALIHESDETEQHWDGIVDNTFAAEQGKNLPVQVVWSPHPIDQLTNLTVLWDGELDFESSSNVTRGVQFYQTVIVPGKPWREWGIESNKGNIGLILNATDKNTIYEIDSAVLIALRTVMPTLIDYIEVYYPGCPDMCYYSQENPANAYATNISLDLGDKNWDGVYDYIYGSYDEAPTEENHLFKYKVENNQIGTYQIGPLLQTGKYYFGFHCLKDSKPNTKFRMQIKNQCKRGCFEHGSCNWETTQCVCSRWISGAECDKTYPGVYALAVSGSVILIAIVVFVVYKAFFLIQSYRSPPEEYDINIQPFEKTHRHSHHSTEDNDSSPLLRETPDDDYD